MSAASAEGLVYMAPIPVREFLATGSAADLLGCAAPVMGVINSEREAPDADRDGEQDRSNDVFHVAFLLLRSA